MAYDIERLDRLDRIKMEHYERLHGGKVELTSLEALDLAEQTDTYARACGPLDLAYNNFVRQSKGYLELAVLLERAGR